MARQFKGVSDGLMRKVFGSPLSSFYEPTFSTSGRNLFLNVEEIHKLALTQSNSESVNSFSDNDNDDKDGSHGDEEVGPSSEDNGRHSDNELNSKGFTPWVVKHDEELISSAVDLKNGSGLQTESFSSGGFPGDKFGSSSQSTR
uniref:Putative ovule protein n=1 Tax=Solanum chacoense TaxID=4108 RepID=A0A0V0I0W9_SOLCH